MDDALSLAIGNDLAELARLVEAASRFLEAREAPPATVYAVSLALEELITNTIKYGYDDPGRHSIAVRLELEPRQVVLRVEDDGHPFDPLAIPPPDTEGALEERSVGGLGIHLVRKLAEGMAYRRRAGRNRVEVRFARTA